MANYTNTCLANYTNSYLAEHFMAYMKFLYKVWFCKLHKFDKNYCSVRNRSFNEADSNEISLKMLIYMSIPLSD